MSDELLPYYNEELDFVRNTAAEFADAHPKIAERLRLGAETVEDPHVGRLIEAFAYLNARIRHKLDDDFPELTDAILSVLYPHYQAPIPSMAIAQFVPAPDLTGPYELERHTVLETEPVDGEPVQFRTGYAVDLWPIEVESAEITAPMLAAGPAMLSRDTTAMVRLVIRCLSDDMTLAKLAPDSLRFHLSGESRQMLPLYELLLNDVLQVAVADSTLDKSPRVLSRDVVQPVGFARDEDVLPYPMQAFPGYRLLSEFFAFPQKYLFFEIGGLGRALRTAGRSAEIYLFLRRTLPEIERIVSAETFALGCTPIVNLFEKAADPIQLDQTVSEYRVVPDERRPRAAEVYAVKNVTVIEPDGQPTEYHPFYGATHGGNADDRHFWTATRRSAPPSNPGSEMYLSLVDLDLDPEAPTGAVAKVSTTCLNRDLPSRLPFGGGQPRLRPTKGGAAINGVKCRTAPTATLRPPRRHGAMWRLISHLTLNHLSITGEKDGAAALREILTLYDLSEARSMVDGIESVKSRTVAARVRRGKRSALSRGVEITVEFDDSRFPGGSVFLFASALERFFALYATINSFTRMVATIRGREVSLRKWPPRAGDKPLV